MLLLNFPCPGYTLPALAFAYLSYPIIVGESGSNRCTALHHEQHGYTSCNKNERSNLIIIAFSSTHHTPMEGRARSIRHIIHQWRNITLNFPSTGVKKYG